jgi:GT2 family glycosyltransferase
VAPLVQKILMAGIPAAGDRPAIEVVIVNYNAGDALTRCVSSVLAQQVPVRVTVADNASSDDSMRCLEGALGGAGQLIMIANRTNPGFAKAVNSVVAGLAGKAKYLLILNPDCEMQPGALAELIAALELDSGAALAGPVVVDRHGQPMKATLRRFPGPWTSLLTFSGLWRLGRWIPALAGVDMTDQVPAETVKAEAVSGAAMLVRQDVFNDLGGMDESYGLHCEDLDLMYRLRQQGRHCLLVPSARVFHDQGTSSKSRPSWVHWQKHLGMQRFFLKFQASRYSLPVRWLVIAGIWIRFALTLPLTWIRN